MKEGMYYMTKRKKLRDYTIPQLDRFRQLCNFTDSELEYFNLKSKDLSNTAISIRMNISISQVSILASRVFNKIQEIEEYL